MKKHCQSRILYSDKFLLKTADKIKPFSMKQTPGEVNIHIFSLKKTTEVYTSRRRELNPDRGNKMQKTMVRILT